MHDATLLLGGTFDPPHLGHLLLAECARVELGARRVTFLPAGDPWRKSHRTVTPATHRLAMLRLAIRGNRRFHIDERELHRSGPTYTVDTLRELAAEGRRPITLILGTDALADFANWREPDAILGLASIAIARKPESLPGSTTGQDAIEAFRVRYPQAATHVLESMPLTYISSTLIRERARSGLPIRYLATDTVVSYIRREALYA